MPIVYKFDAKRDLNMNTMCVQPHDADEQKNKKVERTKSEVPKATLIISSLTKTCYCFDEISRSRWVLFFCFKQFSW